VSGEQKETVMSESLLTTFKPKKREFYDAAKAVSKSAEA